MTKEDLACLDSGVFLNDVIIDFYLKSVPSVGERQFWPVAGRGRPRRGMTACSSSSSPRPPCRYVFLEGEGGAVAERSHVFSSFFYKQLSRRRAAGESDAASVP